MAADPTLTVCQSRPAPSSEALLRSRTSRTAFPQTYFDFPIPGGALVNSWVGLSAPGRAQLQQHLTLPPHFRAHMDRPQISSEFLSPHVKWDCDAHSPSPRSARPSIVTPGGDILSLWRFGGYRVDSGTSMAVSRGLIALR